MLKGTMKIELTDVKTGQTETVLEHNMVTNALANIFKPLGLVKDPSRMYESFGDKTKTLNYAPNPNGLMENICSSGARTESQSL